MPSRYSAMAVSKYSLWVLATNAFSSGVMEKEKPFTGFPDNTVTLGSEDRMESSLLSPSFKNCTTTTCIPLPAARTARPIAAVVFPLPSPQYRWTNPLLIEPLLPP